jgi:hypothetical protein
VESYAWHHAPFKEFMYSSSTIRESLRDPFRRNASREEMLFLQLVLGLQNVDKPDPQSVGLPSVAVEGLHG